MKLNSQEFRTENESKHQTKLKTKQKWKSNKQPLINLMIKKSDWKYNTVSLPLSVSVDVSDVGETSENRGPSSSQTEGKAAVFSGVYGSPERLNVAVIIGLYH